MAVSTNILFENFEKVLNQSPHFQFKLFSIICNDYNRRNNDFFYTIIVAL